ncbi:MAG: PAS domain S-box protein [Sulfuritalea sp.]|nr:PAS domain S-box protein [Sulfuritalea sp.]
MSRNKEIQNSELNDPAEARSTEELLHALQIHKIELEARNEALRQAQITITESRDRYVDLYELAPVGYLTLDNQGLIASINLTGATLLGADRSLLISRRFSDFVMDENQDFWFWQFQAVQCSKNRKRRTGELALRRPNGTPFRVLIDYRKTSIQGVDDYVLLTLTDKSERRSIKYRDQTFNSVFERSPIGIRIAGPDQIYRQINPAFCRMLGYSETELLGMTDLEITHPDDRPMTRDHIKSMVTGAVSYLSKEKRYLKKTGETVWVSLNVAAVRKENSGELLYSIGLVEDITAKREGELQRVASAEQQRKTLVREVHHRIKNNLQSVAGLLQRELGKFVELNPRLEVAISQVNSIAIVHGLQASDPEEAIRLCDSVRSICEAVSELSQRSVQLTIENEYSTYQFFEIDSNEAVPIALVLNELIINAIKHSPDGSEAPTVTLSADGKEAQLVIRNASAGKPEFDMPAGQGLGTGLSLVRSLLPAQGARLTFESDVGGLMLTRLILTPPVVAASNRSRQAPA